MSGAGLGGVGWNRPGVHPDRRHARGQRQQDQHKPDPAMPLIPLVFVMTPRYGRSRPGAKNRGRRKNPGAMSIPRRRLRPNCEGGTNRRPDKEDSDAEDHDISDVRPPGRGRGELLHVRVQELEDCQHRALRRRRPRPEGQPDDGDPLAGRAGADAAERRPDVQVLRGDLAVRHLRDAGRGGRLLEQADRGREGGAVRLARRQVRRLLADHPVRPRASCCATRTRRRPAG